MTDHYDFARNLVKGRIAETIFAQMLREAGSFTVLEFGYEKIVPELVQLGHDYREKGGIIETLSTAPDFAVIDNESKQVHLIEVKYRHALEQKDILKIAKRMSESWNPSYLFVASLDGFYFESIKGIVEKNGKIEPLHQTRISKKIQDKYLQILRDFEGQN